MYGAHGRAFIGRQDNGDDVLEGTKFKLAEHQEYAVYMMDVNPSLGLFYDLGTGKTMIALAWIYRAMQRGEIQTALVVCPASLVSNWGENIDKMTQFEGFTAAGVAELKKAVTVVSFQKTYRVARTPVQHRDGQTTVKRSISLRPEIDRPWGAVIVDELHNLGGHSSIQTKAALTLARLTKHRYGLTATPVTGGKGKEDFSKLYGEIRFLEPDIWPNWTTFCGRYVTNYDRWHNPTDYNIPSCRALMINHAIVCRLEDCFDMPDRVESVISCPLVETKAYRDLKKGNYEPYNIDIEMAGGQYTKMLQVCSGSMKRTPEQGGTLVMRCSKDEAFTEVLNSTNDKVVVFCTYRASVDRCAELCRKAGRDTIVYDGRCRDKSAWKKFQYGSATAIVCQYNSGSEGLDLFASCHMIMWEPCFSARLFKQATGRIYRKGQTKRCEFVYLSTPGTLEEKSWNTVRSGVEITVEMLENWAHGEEF